MDEKKIQLETYANTVLLLSNVARIEQTVEKHGSTLMTHAQALEDLKRHVNQIDATQVANADVISEGREVLLQVKKVKSRWLRFYLSSLIIPFLLTVGTVLWFLDPDVIAVRFLRVISTALLEPSVRYWTHGVIKMDDTVPTNTASKLQ